MNSVREIHFDKTCDDSDGDGGYVVFQSPEHCSFNLFLFTLQLCHLAKQKKQSFFVFFANIAIIIIIIIITVVIACVDTKFSTIK